MEIWPVVAHESTDEGWRGNPNPRMKWGMNTTLSLGSGVGTICPLAGSRWAIPWAKYPASQSSVMFPSVMEEPIHLPYVLDPDLVGVLFGGGNDGRLGAGARERMGREEEGVGERVDLYPLIKAANIKHLPTSLKTRLFPKGLNDTVGLPMPALMRILR